MLLREQCLLGIEGSGFSTSVGVMEKGVARGNLFLNTGAPGSESLLLGIDRLLQLTGIEKESLEGICVTLGPGSFTSLRICLSTAQAIGLGLNIPVYGVDSLVLIAATMPFYPSTVKVIQNAYKGEFYTAAYNTVGGRPEALSDLGLIKPETFFDQLQEGDLVLGNGVEKMIELGLDFSAKNVLWKNDFHRIVSGVGVIEHLLDFEVEAPSDIPLEPIYVRLSEAELNYEKQFGKD